MVNLVKELLLSPAGSFASVFSLFVLAFYLVHWITKKVTEIRTSQEKIESSVDSIYRRMDGRIDKIEAHINDIRKDMAILSAKVDVFQTEKVAQRKSPISLTDLGLSLSEDLKAKDMIAKNWNKIWANLELNIHNKNAYDIQQYIFDTATISLDEFLDKNDVDAIKTFAYKEGRPLAFYAMVFAIPIRDRYLKQKGIDIAAVDNGDPNSKRVIQAS
ncbi:MAG: hypothetical protein LBJ57_06720 [Prevotellaceae bacterium]|nr:hypothetical protein [Prevotellaceae bacterium]